MGVESKAYHEERVLRLRVFELERCAGRRGRVVRVEGSRRLRREELAEACCHKGSGARTTRGEGVDSRCDCAVSTPDGDGRATTASGGWGVRTAVENRACECPENEWPQLSRARRA